MARAGSRVAPAMPPIDIPSLGTVVLCTMMLAAGYTLMTALIATRGRPKFLQAARMGTFATCALVAIAVVLLAYAFQTHDFRIRYVSRYSDRSMTTGYLFTALWGGQDGSLLWWAFLLAGYTSAATLWMRRRYAELQPWVLATLMTIFLFFGVLMLFAANPFALNASGAPPDGEGLNPLLQNYWMAIHPPMLYAGFVGWSIPFAFVVAALVTGRLHDEWLLATRRWVLFAWLALTVGNILGMLWSYEELGWGGYWAWDPVENAAFMPLLVGTAYVHSIMIQERRGMLKVWNVFLLCLTFFMTIFGTFLTRSGLIASVHSFSRSDIGLYFVGYMVLIFIACMALIIWRLPLLKSENSIDSLLSREFSFLLNNWILLGMMMFVLIATTFPLMSEALRNETVTVGPGFYNRWMVPLGLVLLFLTGVGPLIAWRKASGKNLLRAFIVPTVAAVVALLLHLIVGPMIGFPPVVPSPEIYDTFTGKVLGALFSTAPVSSFVVCSWVFAAIAQEFWRGTAMRMRNVKENVLVALVMLVVKARRRYGGYIVHIAVVLMFFGFTGAAYDVELESALTPGGSMTVGDYTLRFAGSRLDEDENKRMIFADMIVSQGGQTLGRVSPAKFIYRKLPDMPTTEVAIASTLAGDLYVILNAVNEETQIGTFKVIVRPFVGWIWIACILMMIGTVIAMLPTWKELLGEARFGARAREASAAATLLLALGAGALLLSGPAAAEAQDASSLHAGQVTVNSLAERQVFERLLCMCGDCERLDLSLCACSEAEARRVEVRARMARGDTIQQISDDYRRQFGAKSISIPADHGLDRALWAVPVLAIVFAAGGVVWLGRRWTARGAAVASAQEAAATAAPETAEAKAKYDDALEDELRKLGD
jgi:cytochrome c-type biogenesis protein CcmF